MSPRRHRRRRRRRPDHRLPARSPGLSTSPSSSATTWSAASAAPGTTATSTSTSARIGFTPRTRAWPSSSATSCSEDAIEIPRKSGARMFGKFHEWPLRPSILLAMPFTLMIARRDDLVFKEHLPASRSKPTSSTSTAATLYDIFFKPYTREVPLLLAGRTAPRLGPRRRQPRRHRQARARRQPVDPAKTTLLPKPVETMFLYPPHGVGHFSDRLAAEHRGPAAARAPARAVDRHRNRGARIVAVTAGERAHRRATTWSGRRR